MEENMMHLRDPKFWASVCAWMVPTAIFVLWIIGIYKNWTISEIGTIIAAIAGPFAALAGFLYIYASFLVQNDAFLLQSEQFKEQRSQFERQSFEFGFYDLINKFLKVSRVLFPTDPRQNLMPQLKKFQNDYKESNTLSQIEPTKELSEDDISAKLNFIAKHYYAAFQASARSILEMNKLFISILLYLDQANIQNKEGYYSLLFTQLSQAEVRVLFYGYFHLGFSLTEEERHLVKKFFQRFNGRDLLDPRDVQLLDLIK